MSEGELPNEVLLTALSSRSILLVLNNWTILSAPVSRLNSTSDTHCIGENDGCSTSLKYILFLYKIDIIVITA